MAETTKPQQAKQFAKHRDKGGAYYLGKCVVAELFGQEFAIVAPDTRGVRFAWERMMTIDLDETRVQGVKVYSAKPKQQTPGGA